MSAEEQRLLRDDLADREQQASALAAAGMVAETVSRTRSVTAPAALASTAPTSMHDHHDQMMLHYGNGQPASNGLQAHATQGAAAAAPPPPQAHYQHHPQQHQQHGTDGINWGIMDFSGGGASTVDDLDLDFAKLFDPAHELESMLTEGSGWPASNLSSSTDAPPPLFSMSPNPMGDGGMNGFSSGFDMPQPPPSSSDF
jgi:hypothetical protein